MPRLCTCLLVFCLGLGLAAQAGATAAPTEDKGALPAVAPAKEAPAGLTDKSASPSERPPLPLPPAEPAPESAVPVPQAAPAPQTAPVPQAAPVPQVPQTGPVAPAPADKPALTPERPPLPPATPAQETRPAAGGPALKWIELSVGGLPLRVSAGGVMSLHPDAPFRVVGVRSDAWLDFGLKVYLAGLPEVDLNRFHTMAELLGDKVYTEGQVDLVAHKSGRDLGSVRLTARLMPIDWLRKAEAAEGIEDKIAYTAKALELTPDDRLLLTRLVDLMVEARRYREAADLLEQQPGYLDDPGLLARLADLYQRLGQGFQEAQVLKHLLEKSPQDVSLLERLSRVCEELERWDEAALYLEALSQALPEAERGAVWRRLGLVLLKTDKKREAAQTLERAVKAQPFDPETWQMLAEARAAAGDGPGALEAQRRVASLAPGDQDAQMRLASSLLEAGKKREATVEMEKAAALKPDDPAVWLRLARLYEELSDRPAQLKAYRQLARLSPRDPDVQFNLAVLLMDQKQPEAALSALEAAAQARPKDADIQGLAIEALSRLGRWEQLAAAALAFIKEHPGDSALALKLYPQLAKHRPQGAAALLDAALEGGAKDPRLYELKAALALDQDDTGQAIKALEAEAQALPANLEIRLRLAELYESSGQDDKALKAYEAILDKDPGYQGAQERYLQLKTRLLDSKERGKQPTPAKPSADR